MLLKLKLNLKDFEFKILFIEDLDFLKKNELFNR